MKLILVIHNLFAWLHTFVHRNTEVIFASGGGTTVAILSLMDSFVLGIAKILQVGAMAGISAYIGHRVKKFLDLNPDFTIKKGIIVSLKYIKHKLYGIFK